VTEPDEADILRFKIDKTEIVCFRPNDGQIAMLLASTSRYTKFETRLAGMIDFMVGTMDDDSREYVVARLMDRDDEFGMEQMEEILEWMVEEWVARPTQPPSDSSPSPKNDGERLTEPTPALT
jgi:hypothetical protein